MGKSLAIPDKKYLPFRENPEKSELRPENGQIHQDMLYVRKNIFLRPQNAHINAPDSDIDEAPLTVSVGGLCPRALHDRRAADAWRVCAAMRYDDVDSKQFNPR